MILAEDRHVTLFLEIAKSDLVARAIDAEIQWCEENPEGSPTEMYREGFIAGLRQARFILTEVQRMVGVDRLLTADDIKEALR